ncbi:MAG: hypothetical protein HC880_03505 [Bacteroidia bacterium]|nr:hypothetical protein [Bacteroidia bacterium]
MINLLKDIDWKTVLIINLIPVLFVFMPFFPLTPWMINLTLSTGLIFIFAKLTWRQIFIINFGLMVLPYLPIAGFLQSFALNIFFVREFLVTFYLLPVLGWGLILLATLAQRKPYLSGVYLSNLATMLMLPVVFLGSHAIVSSEIIQKLERDNIISAGTPVVNALEAYHRDYDHYPKELEQLSPNYLKKLPCKTFPTFSAFQYRRVAELYELKFERECSFFEAQVIEYNPWNNENRDGLTLSETGFNNWKYYIQNNE